MSYKMDIEILKKDIKQNLENVRTIRETKNSRNDEWDLCITFYGTEYDKDKIENNILDKYKDKLEIVGYYCYTITRYHNREFSLLDVYCKLKLKKYGIDLEIEELEVKLAELKQKRKVELQKEKLLTKKQQLLEEIKELESK